MKSIKIPCVGYEIAADWYDGKLDNQNVLLVFVGYTSSKARHQELVANIVKQTGYSALVLDYSGHGESPFNLQDLTPAQNFLEVVTAYDWLKGNYPEKTISVMGASYGGFMAMKLVQYRSPNKLILRVPAMYKPDSFYTKWKDTDLQELRHNYRASPDNFINHPLLDKARNYKGMAYVLTHELDEACPKASTTPIIEALNAETWEAKGAMHSLGDSNYTPEQYRQYENKIVDWLK